ncbi:MAG: hypothetical protein JO294_13510 [Alphaproteobacteria bacterium]|nr:hypothetical protein [Alphaproteobacteria bacterium]
MKFARAAVIAALLIVPVAAFAASGPIEGLIDGFLKCADNPDSSARVACYDGLIPSFRAAKAAPPPAPPIAVAPPAAPPPDKGAWYDPFNVFGTNPSQQVRPEQFGAEHLTPPKPAPGQPEAPPAPEPLDSITAKVSEYSFTPTGKFFVILDNGQIWQQLSNDVTPAHFQKGENVVTIKRGTLGSYNMLLNDSVARFKVKRLK